MRDTMFALQWDKIPGYTGALKKGFDAFVLPLKLYHATEEACTLTLKSLLSSRKPDTFCSKQTFAFQVFWAERDL